MAYKITKYRGKHKIKDTKSGKSVDIDIEKYMNGGTDPEKKKKATKEAKKDNPDFSDQELKEIQDATGIQFTLDGANQLFRRNEEFVPPAPYPDLDLGRYKDVGYFDVTMNGDEYIIKPTAKNFKNAQAYKDDLYYLQKLNPNANIAGKQDLKYYVSNKDRRPQNYEHGGKIVPKYIYGADFECPEGDFDCQERKRLMKERQVAIDDTKVAMPGMKPFTPMGGSPTNLNYEEILSGTAGAALKDGAPDGMVDEATARPKNLTPVSTIKPEGLASLDEYMKIDTPDVSQLIKSNEENIVQQNNNNDDIYNIPNPYAGVDIPSAAHFLGRSIKNKSALGIAAGSLKIATGLGRNIVSGLGYQNRYNQVMKDYYQDQKNNKNPEQYFAYGGKMDEELATGEYMHGIMNPDTEDYNAEIEKGEYFQTNQGDIAEVVGDKHSDGGEKILMEPEDRVLSDKLKLGAKTAKMLSEKYDLNLKAKHTYSDVLDKYRKKSKLDKLIEEESDILKKIGEQKDVKDTTTKNFNLDVLAKKKQEIAEKKHPIEEQRKAMFDELFEIQEESKPQDKNSAKKDEFEYGGDFESLAKEYNIPIDRAKELVQKFNNGGKKKGAAKKEIRPGQSKTDAGFFGNVTPEEYQEFVKRNSSWFDFNEFDPSNPDDVKKLQENYNNLTLGNKVTVDGKFGEQTASLFLGPDLQSAPINTAMPEITAEPINLAKPASTTVPSSDEDFVIKDEEEIKKRNAGLAGMYLFPDESPLPPSGLQGTIKPERRFDRVRSTEIDVEPYLQDIKDREEATVQSLEGLSPNVRAAVLANMRANNQSQESNIRNQIDTQNLQSKERAIYANAQIQAREENASEADRLAYEQRQYRAQALTDLDLNNYYNQLQAINKQRFMDIHNLNLINATNEDVYFDGQTYRRKNSDRDILRQIKI